MCGGGGGSMPDPIDPMKQAEAQLLIDNNNATIQQQAALDAEARAAAKLAEDKLAHTSAVTDARNTAYGGIEQDFSRKGLDATMYDDYIKNALDQAQTGLTFSSGNTSFGADTGATLLDQMRQDRIRENQTSVNSYAPEGFADNIFSNTADDAVIDSILAAQYGDASDAIMRSFDRGTLNQTGYDYAMNNLNTQKTAANSNLQSLGGGVLGGYRTELSTIADNARTGAGSWDFGDTYNPDIYKTKIDNTTADLTGRLEGDIRNALGGEQLFDWQSLIQKGGANQGAVNTGLGSGLQQAFANRTKDENTTRGLGTTGSF